MKYCILALVIFLAGSFDTYAQQWTIIPAQVSKDSASKANTYSKIYADDSYNYGSSTNPSPRIDAVTWSDPDGFLWILGGIGLDESHQWGIFGDMWKYDPSSNTWSFIKGQRNQRMNGEKKEAEMPLPRKEAVSWVDNQGSLWLYGGRQLGDIQHFDDLWKFDKKSNVWTKIAGNAQFNQTAVKGLSKASAKGNTPGSRSCAATWTDNKGNLWLFGGLSAKIGNSSSEFYNDLWMFNPVTNEWSWVNGAEKTNQPSLIGGTSKGAQAYTPASRAKSVSWYDAELNQLFLYGGIGIDSVANLPGGMSDLWAYSIEKGSWSLKSGNSKTNSESSIHSINATSEKNSPGFRISSIGWTGKEGNFYMIGGQNIFSPEQIYVEKNVWVYSVQSNQWKVIPQTESVTTGNSSIFKDKNGTAHLFGGKEFDIKTRQTRPGNSVWKLEL